jgi:hypothetical protein
MKPYLQARNLLIICAMLVIAFFSIRGLMKSDTGCRDKYEVLDSTDTWGRKVVCDKNHVDSKVLLFDSIHATTRGITIFCSCRPIVSK